MRMLSKACSIVASSLPRCSSSSAAPTVAPLSISLSLFLFRGGPRRGFGSGVVGISVGARCRGLQLPRLQPTELGCFARRPLASRVIAECAQSFIVSVVVPSEAMALANFCVNLRGMKRD